MRLRVRVTPRASRTSVEVRGGVVHVRVMAPAIGGRANEALRKALAATLGVAPSRVLLASGAGSRDKLVDVPDEAAEEVRRLLGEAATPSSRVADRARRPGTKSTTA